MLHWRRTEGDLAYKSSTSAPEEIPNAARM